MKKQVLFLSSFLMLGATLHAQTWSSTNEPAISATTIMYVVDSNAVNYSGNVGAGQTFDYSEIGGYIDNDRIISVNDATASIYSSEFPSSTHNLVIPGFIENFYTFDTDNKQGQGFVLMIDGIGEAIIEFNANNQQMLEYPTSLGSGFTDSYSGNFIFAGESNPAIGDTWVLADASGTLILANGVSHTDVLRVKTIDTTYTEFDPLGFGVPFPLTIAREQYDYFKPGTSSFPLFVHTNFNVVTTGFATSIGVVLSSENPSGFVGLSEDILAGKEFGLYPNPTNGVFTASLPTIDANSSIVILDAIGKVVKTIAPTTSNTEINLANEPKGVYFVRMSSSTDSKTMKLIVR